MAKARKSPKKRLTANVDRNSRATVSGPAAPDARKSSHDDLTAKTAGTDALAAAMPFNANKPLEYGNDPDEAPPAGVPVKPDDPIVGSSTVTEANGSEKTGSGSPVVGTNKTIAPLDRVRVDSSNQMLTTNQGDRKSTRLNSSHRT